MSEFGNETATAALNLTGKGIEVLLQLLKYLSERNERKLNNELRKENLRKIKTDRQKEILSKKRGYIGMNKLINSGDKLMSLSVPVSQKELERFGKLAKLEGIQFSAISNQAVLDKIKDIKKELNDLKLEGCLQDEKGHIDKASFDKSRLSDENAKKYDLLNKQLEELEKQRDDRILIIKAKDLESVKNITDRMNMEIRLDDIEMEIAEYQAKGIDNLSEEEKRRYEDLQIEKEGLLRNEFNEFNNKNNDTIIEGATKGSMYEELSFEKALNRVTDRKYAEQPCYICERTNPANYMEVTSEQLVSPEGNPFTNTEYKVFNQGIQQKSKEFSHGRFTHYTDSKGESTSTYGQEHWDNMKKEIKEKGGFTDDVLVFSCKEDYLQYKAEMEKAAESINLTEDNIEMEIDKYTYKDYVGNMNRLKGQLAERDLAINENKEIYNTNTGEILGLNENMNDDEVIEVADAINIGKQLELYERLNANQTQMAFVRQQQEINEENFAKQGRPESLKPMYEQMRENLHKQVYDMANDEVIMRSQINKLEVEREQLSSVKIVDLMQDKNEEEIKRKKQRELKERDFKSKDSIFSDGKAPHSEEHVQSKEKWSKQADGQSLTDEIAKEVTKVKSAGKIIENNELE